MKVEWTRAATRDRNEVVDHIALDNERAAVRMDELFGEAASRLARFPFMGRPGDLVGTRELIPHPSYRMVYEVREETVYIIYLVHTARQWPPVTDD